MVSFYRLVCVLRFLSFQKIMVHSKEYLSYDTLTWMTLPFRKFISAVVEPDQGAGVPVRVPEQDGSMAQVYI